MHNKWLLYGPKPNWANVAFNLFSNKSPHTRTSVGNPQTPCDIYTKPNGLYKLVTFCWQHDCILLMNMTNDVKAHFRDCMHAPIFLRNGIFIYETSSDILTITQLYMMQMFSRKFYQMLKKSKFDNFKILLIWQPANFSEFWNKYILMKTANTIHTTNTE